ncbi:uncharacterized protein GGS22DRAFT_94055 [Annulohypoxylon maeteangense]|uniref:uncharacterized protein n=1 Tax=Annulohypoxylon maeteangense TaxID=1927788 RepID=UPI00200886F9|nr:uncharacterized protein GGS22DRAFT_94055 [Annulohypoxylon maeteangense]KAI0888164.1 hypothetical protein GGS22DRAFT_94055 [Annulohypoxylon maeteangense]
MLSSMLQEAVIKLYPRTPRARFGLSMVRYSLVFFFHLRRFKYCFSLCVYHAASQPASTLHVLYAHTPVLLFFINSFYHTIPSSFFLPLTYSGWVIDGLDVYHIVHLYFSSFLFYGSPALSPLGLVSIDVTRTNTCTVPGYIVYPRAPFSSRKVRKMEVDDGSFFSFSFR